MITFESLDDNFRFLILELEKQARDALGFFENKGGDALRSVMHRRDKIDDRKARVENDCYVVMGSGRELSDKESLRIRAMQVVCNSLERMSYLFDQMVRRVDENRNFNALGGIDIQSGFEMILTGITTLYPAFNGKSMDGALGLCNVKSRLEALFKPVLAKMEKGGESVFISDLDVIHAFERLGDELLFSGEAVLFSIVGEKIRKEQFESLRKTLTESGVYDCLSKVDYKAILGTRSGCRIGWVDSQDGLFTHGSIYKEGPKEKIVKEVKANAKWQSLSPELVPAIYNVTEQGEKASMLVSYLPGKTLDHLLVESDGRAFPFAWKTLLETLILFWGETLKSEPVPSDHMVQLQKRQKDVLSVHPDFSRESLSICGTDIVSFEKMIERCAFLEKEVSAPFSVLIHGDFNLNNIIYNQKDRKICYIDLHRSRDGDYVQDASVCLVSHFRMPLFDGLRKGRINEGMGRIFTFVEDFAATRGDSLFYFRMALALARSFYTSTRFELSRPFAREMYNRSCYLLERVLAWQGAKEDFRLSVEVLNR